MAEPIFKTIDFKSDIKSAKVSHDGSVVIQLDADEVGLNLLSEIMATGVVDVHITGKQVELLGDDETDGQIDLLDQEGEDDGE
ncbi:hypothetical protein [Limosilactobacillus oris]|uniref:hypothetical protein n=1 Tax=Limosilactobacillus oris TaxID=1632 RepID=UPI002235E3A8|nr:hypothetical protein [Limosilactobacillus oris]MCW4387097.1 hypothetical protein [Limosilactobacillus oris]